MEFEYYCIVALGQINGISDIIRKISDMKVTQIEQKGVLIATFSSNFTIGELKELIGGDRRTFFIFPANPEITAFNIGLDDKHDEMFGHILNIYANKELNELSLKLESIHVESQEIDLRPELVVERMGREERSNKIDELLEKGVENLNEDEQKILEILSKNLD